MRKQKVKAASPASTMAAHAEARVSVVHVEARALYNLRADDPVWEGGADEVRVFPSESIRDSLVKVQPPADASDAAVNLVEGALRSAGAAEVRVMPRPRQKAAGAAARVGGSHRKVRATVEAMVEEFPTRDREALRAEVRQALDEAGL